MNKIKQFLLVASAFFVIYASPGSAQDSTKLIAWCDAVRVPFCEAFDQSRDDLTVEFVSVAGNEIVTQLQLALTAGDGVPDAIFMPDVNQAAQLSTRRTNYLMELSDKVDQKIIDGFYPTSLAPCE